MKIRKVGACEHRCAEQGDCEGGLVAAKGLGILFEEAGSFLPAAPGRAVMERAAKHFGAKSLPVILRVRKVKLPGLIDRVGRGDRVRGGDRKVKEAPVFLKDARGLSCTPAVLAGKAPGMGEFGIDRTHLAARQCLPQRTCCCRN